MDSTYRPAPQVLERLKLVTFVAVVGPTSVGKTTLINAAVKREPSLHLVLNNTSRQPRETERDGVDYLFRSRESMEARIAKGEYVQVAPSILGELYATAPEGYSTEGVAAMAVLAEAIPAFRQSPFKNLRSVFITPPDWETWQQRLLAHNFTPEHRARRLREAQTSFVFALEDPHTTIVVNDDLATATQDFIDLALGKPLSPRLQAEQSNGRTIIRDLLAHLKLGIIKGGVRL